MKLRLPRFDQLLIAVTLFSFVAPGISYVNVVFNTATRWFVLVGVSLLIFVFKRAAVRKAFRQPVFISGLLYGVWGLLTVLWSEVPFLSFAKALVYFWVFSTMLLAGYYWVMRVNAAHSLDFLALFSIAVLLSSQGGRMSQDAIYIGLTENANFLGSTLAIGSTWLAWRAALSFRSRQKICAIYGVLLAVSAYYMWLAHSRAALLMFACVLGGLVLGLDKKARTIAGAAVVIGCLVFALVYFFSPSLQDSLEGYFLKSDRELVTRSGSGAFYSREEAWEESYQRAKLGGSFGGGLGVTIGEGFVGELGSTVSSGQYGREHGNTQFAIVEQIGLVGFGLYLVLLVNIALLWMGSLRAAEGTYKLAVGLLGGAIMGLLVQSVFEAWWVAPGAVESASMWTLLGALLGVNQRSRTSASGGHSIS
jgi:hypothetical protein